MKPKHFNICTYNFHFFQRIFCTFILLQFGHKNA